MDILVYEEKKVYLVFPVKQADMVSYYFISQFYKIIYFVLGFNGAPGIPGKMGRQGKLIFNISSFNNIVFFRLRISWITRNERKRWIIGTSRCKRYSW
jgi:hypothetical protein